MKNIHRIVLCIGVVIVPLLISAYKSSVERTCQEPPSFTLTVGVPPIASTLSKPDTSPEVKTHRPAGYSSQPQEDKKEAPVQDQFTLPERIAEWMPFHCTNALQEKHPDEKDPPEEYGSPNGYPALP